MAIGLMINRMEGNALGCSTLTAFCVFILTAGSAQSASGQGYCNESVPVSLWTECEGCISSYFPLGDACPSGMLQTTRAHGVRDCHYMLHTSQSSVVKYMGCRHHCTGTTVLPKCCPGYYGPDCQECPGGSFEPCSGHGYCSDGLFGNGTCSCNSSFIGTACEKCESAKVYGPTCDKECQCEYGVCNSGASGDGSCDCDAGYQGVYCSTRTECINSKADIALVINYEAEESVVDSLDLDSSSGESVRTESPQINHIRLIKDALVHFISEFYIKANRIQIGFTFDNVRISPGSLNDKNLLRQFVEEKQFDQLKPVDMSVLLQEVVDQFTTLNGMDFRKDSTKVVIILTNSITDWSIDKTVKTAQEMNFNDVEIYTIGLLDTPVVKFVLNQVTKERNLKSPQLNPFGLKAAFDEILVDLCNKSSLSEIPSCDTISCDPNGHCIEEEGGPVCLCDHGYKGDGLFCEAINHCLDEPGPCSVNASCLYLGPAAYNCSCNEGYRGDGIVCVAVDPCEQDYGGCPVDTTDCIYQGPGLNSCECMEGYENYTAYIGCTLIDVCDLDDSLCHGNANCTTTGPLEHECTCQAGYVGDGITCYGNIIERIKELHNMPNETFKGKFTTSLRLMEEAYNEALTQHGPFTVFVSTDQGFDGTFSRAELIYLLSHPSYERQILRQHMLAGEFLIEELTNVTSIYTLQGTQAEISYKPFFGESGGSRISYRLQGHYYTAAVIIANIKAANGLIHVIDKVLDKSPVVIGSPQKTVWEVLSSDGRYNRFEAMLETAGMRPLLDSAGGTWTVFAPHNSIWDSLPPGTFKYLQSGEGKGKLIRLLNYHIIQNATVGVADLINMERVETRARMFVDVDVTELGQVQLNSKVNISQTDISASNGLLHHLDGVLLHSYLQPLLPHRCDITTSTTVYGACGFCFGAYSHVQCPLFSDTPLKVMSCVNVPGYRSFPWSSQDYAHPHINDRGRMNLFSCKRVCQRHEKVKKCCPGFYGTDCYPCIGGHQEPCFGRGTCDDGLTGIGLCSCNASYKGAACEKCADENKFGPGCAQECHCLHGQCDSDVDSDGACLPNTCQAGYQGENCDFQVKKCARRLRCHAHAQCVRTTSLGKVLSDKSLTSKLNMMSRRKRKKWLRRYSIRGQCRCIPGYRADGSKCTEIDPCQEEARGGCDKQARCYKTGPGLSSCECVEGWVGDGLYCYPSTPCQSHTSCHVHAQCLPSTPGKYVCVCKEDFHGNGTHCVPNNICLTNHGGCHRMASCVPSGPGQANCTCPSRLGGDGYSCYGSIAYEIRNHPQLTKLYELLQTLHNGEDFLDDLNSTYTLFAPRDEALTPFKQTAESDFWMDEGNVMILASYHSVPGVMPMDYLKNTTTDTLYTLVARDRFPINITFQEETMYVNEAQVVLGDQPALNGLIHIIDRVLEPYPVRAKQPDLGQLLAQNGNYSRFLSLLNDSGTLDAIEDMDQYTIFVPTDLAVSSMNMSQMLSSRYLAYFIIPEELPMWKLVGKNMNFSSLLGDHLQASLSITSKQNEVFVNDVPVLEGDMWTSGGVAHGIAGVLQPVLNWCDVLSYDQQWGGCGRCLSGEVDLCPQHYEPATPLTQETNCTYLPQGSAIQRSGGCKILCVKSKVEKMCCPGYYGSDCRECPGGSALPCRGHGQCDEGVSGFGACSCHYGYAGPSCARCTLGRCEEASCGVNLGDCPLNTECRLLSGVEWASTPSDTLSGVEWASTPSDTQACVCQPSQPQIPTCSIIELLTFIPNITIFSQLFKASQLGQAMESGLLYSDNNATLHSISLFVPLDSGMANVQTLNDSTNSFLLDHIFKDEIVLGSHIDNGTSLKSMSSLWLTINKYFRNSTVNETFTVNGVPVVTANVICINGVIHLLSGPLLSLEPSYSSVIGLPQHMSPAVWAGLSVILLLVCVGLVVFIILRKRRTRLLNCGKEGSMQFSTLSSTHSEDLEPSEGTTFVSSDKLGKIQTSLFENSAMENDFVDDSQFLIDTY